MEKHITQQEILLMTGTAFFRQQCYERNEKEHGERLNQREKMEEACWNGLLPELLPEIIEKNEAGKALSLWQVKQGKSFVEIDLCNIPEQNNHAFSIDPYRFLSFICES